jgi:probable F420-dependent oxidoreductase
MDLGRTGIWSAELRFGDPGAIAAAAAELEDLGYGTLWVPGGIGGEVFLESERLLAHTRRAKVAIGVLNLWMHTANETAAEHHALTHRFPGRFLLGIGVSHSALIDTEWNQRYQRPVASTAAFLDGLDAAEHPVPVEERVLAALGPNMLALARDRAAGVHPYLVPPEHSAIAREAVGPGALVAPCQHAVLDTDPTTARATAREMLAIYLTLPNYVRSWLRLGMTEDDVAGAGSDHLVDTVVAWGDEAAIAARVQAHLDAGADHVCVQVAKTPADDAMPLEAWRRLAPVLNS